MKVGREILVLGRREKRVERRVNQNQGYIKSHTETNYFVK